ncbi:hypothetical protein ACQFX9_23480 [Aliinostoc sp. HNIBRCY26]|uniref:hypothetical protein n=1 Tax=Aliinostoc sp. HNIBRCY26 TaxID=3418997 RepID=UPI003D008A9F
MVIAIAPDSSSLSFEIVGKASQKSNMNPIFSVTNHIPTQMRLQLTFHAMWKS